MSLKIKVNAIVACSENNGIGKNGKLPWTLREEMKYFSRMTKTTQDSKKKNAVLMGRKTWQSIPDQFRPLPGRTNFLVSTQAAKNPESFPGCLRFDNILDALKKAEEKSEELETIWVIGGASIYQEVINLNFLHRIYLTRILKPFDCDTFLPEIPFEKYKLVQDPAVPVDEQVEGDLKYKYEVYEKIEV